MEIALDLQPYAIANRQAGVSKAEGYGFERGAIPKVAAFREFAQSFSRLGYELDALPCDGMCRICIAWLILLVQQGH
jgi:hypothetical protein